MSAERLGRYTILKHLASGGMADVLLARTDGIEGFERHVVVKRIRAEHAREQRFIQMFLDEARVAAGLHHQNIVQVHDIGETDGEYFFAMEYLHGEDVRKMLSKVAKNRAHVPLAHVVSIIAGVAAGLHHAHERHGSDGRALGIVHRDVSPSNIIVGYDGSVKIVDFGIAKAAMRQVETRGGSRKGKVSYMSPEQCKGESVDRRSDIYALGVVLYELATTTRLFKSDNEYSVMDTIVQGKVPLPRTRRHDVPNDLSVIIMRALAANPARRFQTADELRAELEQFAIKHELTAATSALATYMHKLFGKRPEPWLDPTIGVPRSDGSMSSANSWTEVPRETSSLPPSGATELTTGRRARPDTRTSGHFGFERAKPAARSHAGAKLAMIGLPLLAIAGVATWHFGLRGASDGGTAPAPTPASNASGAATPSEATVPGGAKVEVQLEANVANARVSFRRHLEAAPLKTDLAPSDMVELVEVSAPGYKTERYWLTFDRPTHLVAHLSRGDGLEEATEEQTLVALGEAAAPQQPAATVRRASAVSAQPRKIGHGAAEVSPPPSGAVEPPAQALERPAEPAVPVPPAGSEPSTAGPAAAHDAPATPALAPAKAEDARAIAPATLKALLVASSPIDVPELVKTQMQRDENKKASAVIKVCIGTEGAVTHASVIKSSGYPAYDNSLVTAVRGWRYRAYVVDGRAVPACSAVAVSSVVP